MNEPYLKIIGDWVVLNLDIIKRTKETLVSISDSDYFDKPFENTMEYRVETAKILDRYILHIIEELYEVHDAILNKSNYDAMEEIIDCIAYIISLKTILKLEDESLIKVDDIQDIIKGNKNVLNKFSEDYMIPIIYSLIEIRRKIPERKWQYRVDRTSEYNLKQTILDIHVKLKDILKDLLILFLKVSYNKLNECFKEDGEKILMYRSVDDFNILFDSKNDLVLIKTRYY